MLTSIANPVSRSGDALLLGASPRALTGPDCRIRRTQSVLNPPTHPRPATPIREPARPSATGIKPVEPDHAGSTHLTDPTPQELVGVRHRRRRRRGSAAYTIPADGVARRHTGGGEPGPRTRRTAEPNRRGTYARPKMTASSGPSELRVSPGGRSARRCHVAPSRRTKDATGYRRGALGAKPQSGALAVEWHANQITPPSQRDRSATSVGTLVTGARRHRRRRRRRGDNGGGGTDARFRG